MLTPLLFILFILCAGIYAMCTPPPSYKRMTFEEEVNWLMKDFGMTREEAEEIADM